MAEAGMLRPVVIATLSFASILPLSGGTRGDEPPSREEFEVCTTGGTYCAEIRGAGTGEAPAGQREYRVHVLSKREDPPREIWSRRYEYDGHPEGQLTEDGRRFVYVSQWYRRDAAAVRILSEDGAFALNGDAFRIPANALQRTVSHELWLADGPRAYYLDGDRLVITTRDGQVHRVDLGTGQLSR
jgi:hypothetical protein